MRLCDRKRNFLHSAFGIQKKNITKTKRRLCDEIVRSKRRERGRVKGTKGKGRNENIEIKKYSFEKIFTRGRKKTTRG